MMSLRVAVVAVSCVMVGCRGSDDDAARSSPGVNAAEVERGQLEAVVSLIAARELCSEPMNAPARRANFDAANQRHKKTIDTIANLDWRTAEITPAQVEALNTAKLQINRAEVIDLATALRQDFQPPAGKRVEAAYTESAAVIERLASEQWSTSKIGEAESKAIAKIGQALLVARLIDQADLLAASTSSRVQSSFEELKQTIQGLTAKDWKSQSATDAEVKAVGALVNAHMQDLAVALDRLERLVPPSGTSKVYESHREVLNRVASKKPGEDVTKEEQAALCEVLKAHAEGR